MAKATLVCIRARSYINVKDTLVEWVHEYSLKLHSAKFHFLSGQKTCFESRVSKLLRLSSGSSQHHGHHLII